MNEVHVRIIQHPTHSVWHDAMKNNETFKRIIAKGGSDYVSFEEYERFYQEASVAPGYDKSATHKPFYAK